MDASVSVRPKQTDMFARLKDIIVTNVDLTSIHKKVIKKMCFSIEIYFCFFVSGDVFNHLFSVYVVSSCVRQFVGNWPRIWSLSAFTLYIDCCCC